MIPTTPPPSSSAASSAFATLSPSTCTTFKMTTTLAPLPPQLPASPPPSSSTIPTPPPSPLPELSSTCEACSQPHDGTYGSGRFCTVHCARRIAASRKWQKQRLQQKLNLQQQHHHHHAQPTIAKQNRKRNRTTISPPPPPPPPPSGIISHANITPHHVYHSQPHTLCSVYQTQQPPPVSHPVSHPAQHVHNSTVHSHQPQQHQTLAHPQPQSYVRYPHTPSPFFEYSHLNHQLQPPPYYTSCTPPPAPTSTPPYYQFHPALYHPHSQPHHHQYPHRYVSSPSAPYAYAHTLPIMAPPPPPPPTPAQENGKVHTGTVEGRERELIAEALLCLRSSSRNSPSFGEDN